LVVVSATGALDKTKLLLPEKQRNPTINSPLWQASWHARRAGFARLFCYRASLPAVRKQVEAIRADLDHVDPRVYQRSPSALWAPSPAKERGRRGNW